MRDSSIINKRMINWLSMNKKIFLMLMLSSFSWCTYAQEAPDKAKIKDIVDKKVKTLENYISILVKKDKPNLENVVNDIMKLWNNDNQYIVTILSKNKAAKDAKTTHVRPYFTTMAKLPYKGMDVAYRNYSYVSNIIKQPDGTYRGTVTFQSEFTSFNEEGAPVYNNKRDINITIVVIVTPYIKDGNRKDAFDLFFGDMGVTESR